MHAMLAVTSTAYILHYIPHCHAKLYVMVNESYYILCMKSCTSCQSMNCESTSLAYASCMAAM